MRLANRYVSIHVCFFFTALSLFFYLYGPNREERQEIGLKKRGTYMSRRSICGNQTWVDTGTMAGMVSALAG